MSQLANENGNPLRRHLLKSNDCSSRSRILILMTVPKLRDPLPPCFAFITWLVCVGKKKDSRDAASEKDSQHRLTFCSGIHEPTSLEAFVTCDYFIPINRSFQIW